MPSRPLRRTTPRLSQSGQARPRIGAELLFRRAVALFIAADERREGALEQARDALVAAGEKETAAEAEAYLSRAAWFAGHRDIAQAHLEHAEELLEGAGPSVGSGSRAELLRTASLPGRCPRRGATNGGSRARHSRWPRSFTSTSYARTR